MWRLRMWRRKSINVLMIVLAGACVLLLLRNLGHYSRLISGHENRVPSSHDIGSLYSAGVQHTAQGAGKAGSVNKGASGAGEGRVGPARDGAGAPEDGVQPPPPPIRSEDIHRIETGPAIPARPKGPVTEQQHFQETCPGRSYVFSAYYDCRRRKHIVKVMGVADIVDPCHPTLCSVWIQGQSEPGIYKVKVIIGPEIHEKRFAAVIYACWLQTDDVPYAVTISSAQSSVTLPVLHFGLAVTSQLQSGGRKQVRPTYSREPPSQFTVCVSPLHSAYDNINQLVEMIEVNGLYGADKFVFYNHSIGAKLNQYLRGYATDGVVDIVQWPINMEPKWFLKDLHYFGQIAAMNDCLYRNMYTTKYVVFLDIDEIIVPKTVSNWTGIVANVSVHDQFVPRCSFIVPNAFFRTDWAMDNTMHDKRLYQYQITTLLYTRRERFTYEHGVRSKYFGDADRVEVAGIHVPQVCANPRYDDNVSEKVALLHHYRFWRESNQHDWSLDRSLQRRTSEIVSRIERRHKLLANTA